VFHLDDEQADPLALAEQSGRTSTADALRKLQLKVRHCNALRGVGWCWVKRVWRACPQAAGCSCGAPPHALHYVDLLHYKENILDRANATTAADNNNESLTCFNAAAVTTVGSNGHAASGAQSGCSWQGRRTGVG
jgi:hypothetical protein